MDSSIRILLLEDNSNDAELVRSAIESSSMQTQITWVDDKKTFVDAVENGAYDVILSDYRLPSFDGMSALKIAKKKFPQVPFIFVSGTIGDDLAADTLKKGASDYILKDRLSKLPSAILRSLREVETQSAQKLAEAQLRTVIRLIPGVIYQYEITEKGERTFPFISEGVKELCGVKPEEIYANPGILFQMIHEDDIGSFLNSIEESYRTLQPWSGDFRISAGKGKEKWVHGHSIPQKKEDGSILWNGILTDVTQRKIADDKLNASLSERKIIERELLASLERFNLALQASNDGLWEWDTRDTVYYSPRFKELLGYAETDPWPDKISEFKSKLHADDAKKFSGGLQQHLDNKVPFDAEFRLRHKNGEYHWFRILGLAARDAAGKPIRMVGSISDQTERKKVESQLLQAQKMQTIGTLAGGIAHDLNNQLTPINGFIDLALSQLEVHDPIYGYLSEAHLSVHRCKEIIQRLMSFSRPSTQDKKVIYLKASFKEMESFFSKLLPSTIAVDFDSDRELWPVLGNETELQTIFLNLAANARDAMAQGGNIKVNLRNLKVEEAAQIKMLKPQPYVLATFTDTGAGIPEEALARIFEPFFTTKPVGQGTGLGLAMVFKIVQDHGGHVTVSSEPGKGATFNIYIPAKPEAIEEAKMSGRKEIKNIAREGECILFADDEEGIRNLGVLFLKRLGFQVIQAKDGEEAIRLYKENNNKITLVIMDITMPKLSGKQALKGLLAVDPAVNVILSSGYTSEGVFDDFIKDGAKGFIQKPYSLQSFSDVLCDVLKRNLTLK